MSCKKGYLRQLYELLKNREDTGAFIPNMYNSKDFNNLSCVGNNKIAV